MVRKSRISRKTDSNCALIRNRQEVRMRGRFSHKKNFENVLADNRPYRNKYVSARTAIATFRRKRNIFLGGIGFYVFCGSCIGNFLLWRAFVTAR